MQICINSHKQQFCASLPFAVFHFCASLPSAGEIRATLLSFYRPYLELFYVSVLTNLFKHVFTMQWMISIDRVGMFAFKLIIVYSFKHIFDQSCIRFQVNVAVCRFPVKNMYLQIWTLSKN